MDLASYQHLKLERQPGGVMLVTLNRPEVLNAAHEAMHSELATIWADLSRDDETRVVVVTGAGRAFSAGGDLGMVERQIGNYDLVTSMLREMSDLVYNMANCEKPIVSAINGVAVGAGLVVALHGRRISICADDARLGDGHVRLGVAAGDHAAIIWPLLCGLAKAKYYLLTGEMVSGNEAGERIGLVSKAVPAGRGAAGGHAGSDPAGDRAAACYPAHEAGAEWLGAQRRTDLRSVGRLRDAHLHGRGHQRGAGLAAGKAGSAVRLSLAFSSQCARRNLPSLSTPARCPARKARGRRSPDRGWC